MKKGRRAPPDKRVTREDLDAMKKAAAERRKAARKKKTAPTNPSPVRSVTADTAEQATAADDGEAVKITIDSSTVEAVAHDLIERGDPDIIDCGIGALLKERGINGMDVSMASLMAICRLADRELERRRIANKKLKGHERGIQSGVRALIEANA